MSGIAGGDGNPGSGVKIMTCQLFDGQYGATLAAEAKAIKYAADNGAVILQCSWGYNSPDANEALGYTPDRKTNRIGKNQYPLERSTGLLHPQCRFTQRCDRRWFGYLCIGNEYAPSSSFPAGYSKCISVSAIAADYTPSSYTNYGEEITLCAPGGDGDYYGTPG